MNTAHTIKQQEKNRLLLKVVEWAQKHNRKVEDLHRYEIIEAIRCKF